MGIKFKRHIITVIISAYISLRLYFFPDKLISVDA